MFGEIFQHIQAARNGCGASVLYLLDRFQPLLRKYARQLGYEDAYADLRAHFIYLITEAPIRGKDDAACVAFITVSIKNKAFRLKKVERAKSAVYLEDIYPNGTDACAELQAKDDYSALELAEFMALLPKPSGKYSS